MNTATFPTSNTLSAPLAISINIIGAGAWGTALAVCLSQHSHEDSTVPTTLFLLCRTPEQANALKATRENRNYLPNINIPQEVHIVDLASRAMALKKISLTDARVASQDKPIQALSIAVLCIPVKHLQAFALLHAEFLCGFDWLLIASKGFEAGSAELPPSIIHKVLSQQNLNTGKRSMPDIGMISGPSFATELADKKPTALTLAMPSLIQAQRAASILSRGHFRVYPSDDVVGVAAAGALKNILALAAGLSDGFDLGVNARAALLTRGMHEMMRLIIAMGGQKETIYGLSGVGDVMLTCMSDLSRNRRAGILLASRAKQSASSLPINIEQQLSGIGTVEGINSTQSIHALIGQLKLSAPICEAVANIVQGKMSLQQAIHALMNRPLREHEKD